MKRNIKKILYGSILFVVLVWLIYYSIEKSELTEISGYLQQEPKFEKGKGAWYMELDLDSDQYKYQTDGLSYEALDKKSVKTEITAGSRIQILVSKILGLKK